MTKKKGTALAALLIAALTALDLGTKALAAEKLSGGPVSLWEDVFEFRYLENHQLHTVAAECGYCLENHHHALASEFIKP